MKYLLFISFIFMVSCETAGELKQKQPQIHKRSGRLIKVAVIDTGFDFNSTWDKNSTPILCDAGHKSFSGDDQDNHGHGTHIAGLIHSNAGQANYCLVILKYFDPRKLSADNLSNSNKAFKRAIDLKVNVINYSGGGSEKSEDECKLIKLALDNGIKVVAAAGNERSDLSKVPYYPAMCDSRVIIVTSKDTDNNRLPSSNYFTVKPKNLTVIAELGYNVYSTLPDGKYGFMTGTSQATAIITGKLVKQLSKK
jgi:subtilisin family serine protease